MPLDEAGDAERPGSVAGAKDNDGGSGSLKRILHEAIERVQGQSEGPRKEGDCGGMKRARHWERSDSGRTSKCSRAASGWL